MASAHWCPHIKPCLLKIRERERIFSKRKEQDAQRNTIKIYIQKGDTSRGIEFENMQISKKHVFIQEYTLLKIP